MPIEQACIPRAELDRFLDPDGGDGAGSDAALGLEDVVLVIYCGRKCLGEVLELHEDGRFDLQWWGQNTKGGRFNPAWIDGEGLEVYQTEKTAKQANLEPYRAEGLGIDDIIAIVPRHARRTAREKGFVSDAITRQIGQKVK